MEFTVKDLPLIAFPLSISLMGCNKINESKQEVTPQEENKMETVTVQMTPEERTKAGKGLAPERIDSLIKAGKAILHYKDGITKVVIFEKDKIVTTYLTGEEAKSIKSNK